MADSEDETDPLSLTTEEQITTQAMPDHPTSVPKTRYLDPNIFSTSHHQMMTPEITPIHPNPFSIQGRNRNISDHHPTTPTMSGQQLKAPYMPRFPSVMRTPFQHTSAETLLDQRTKTLHIADQHIRAVEGGYQLPSPQAISHHQFRLQTVPDQQRIDHHWAYIHPRFETMLHQQMGTFSTTYQQPGIPDMPDQQRVSPSMTYLYPRTQAMLDPPLSVLQDSNQQMRPPNQQIRTQGMTYLDSNTQGMTYLDSNTQGMTYLDSNTQGMTYLDSNTQGMTHLDSNTQGMTYLLSNTQGMTYLDSNTQGMTYLDSNNQAMLHQQTKSLPVSNEQMITQDIASLHSSDQAVLNRQRMGVAMPSQHVLISEQEMFQQAILNPHIGIQHMPHQNMSHTSMPVQQLDTRIISHQQMGTKDLCDEQMGNPRGPDQEMRTGGTSRQFTGTLDRSGLWPQGPDLTDPQTRTLDPTRAPCWTEAMTGDHTSGESRTFNIDGENMTPGLGQTLSGALGQEILQLRIAEARKVFVATNSFKHVKRILDQFRHVTICGASGEGKTTMALMLARVYMKKGYQAFIIENIDKFDFSECINSSPRVILIFDDTFGSVGLSSDVMQLRTLLESIKTYMQHCRKAFGKDSTSRENAQNKAHNPEKEKENMDIRVVFTSKTYNFDEGMSKLKYQKFSFFSGQTVIDMTTNTEFCYSNDAKVAIFERHKAINASVSVHDIDKGDILGLDGTLFGFPLTCKLFFEFPAFRGSPKDFFKRPLFYLQMELSHIMNLNDNKTAALLLMILSENKLDLSKLELRGQDAKMDEMFQCVTDIVPSATRSGIATAARSFRGTFFSSGDTLQFAHPSIYDASACVMYSINPSFVLKYCSYDFLYERVKSRTVEETGASEHRHYIFVSRNYHGLIAARLADGIKQGHFSKTLTHPVLKIKEVVQLLFQRLKDGCGQGKDKESNWTEKKDMGKGFLYWAVHGQNSMFIEEIETVVQIVFGQADIKEALYGCIENNHLNLLKFLSSRLNGPDSLLMSKLLLFCADNGNFDTAQHLLTVGADLRFSNTSRQNYIHLLCQGGKSSMLKVLQTHQGSLFTREDYLSAITSADEDGRTPLMLAAMSGSEECFRLLSKESSFELTDIYGKNLLHLACEGGNLAIVRNISPLFDINSTEKNWWTPIMNAAYGGHQGIFDFLVLQKADLTLLDETRNSLLHLACLGGSREIVEHLLMPTNINIRGQHGGTPVMMAALKGHHNVFELLVSQKADLSLVDYYGDSLLHIACHGGNTKIVQHLLTSFNINKRGRDGRTPVMIAAVSGHQSIFELLVSYKADIKLVDDNGENLLNLASLGGSTEIVRHLLTPLNIGNKGSHGWTPIMMAAYGGHKNVFDFLISHNAEVTSVDASGDSILHLACRGGSIEIVQYLLSSSNINSRGEHNVTPLLMAAYSGNKNIFDYLVSHGADITLVDDEGNSLIHLACLGGNIEIVRHLLTTANINNRGQFGGTPVMMAAFCGHKNVFDFLVSNGADLTVVDDDRNTLLHVACLGGNPDIVRHLLTPSNINLRGQNGGTPVMMAAAKGNQPVFDLLVLNKADLTLIDEIDDNILLLACEGGNAEIVRQLLTPSNINCKGGDGWTPVMNAAVNGNKNVYDFLVSQNADLTLLDDEGNSVLHLACQGGNTDIVQHQTTADNINSPGEHGWTPIMIAVKSGHQSVFEFLLSCNADLTLVDKYGDRLLHLACSRGNTEIIHQLLSSSNINSRGEHGRTAVMKAAAYGHEGVFNLLVAHGADLTLLDNHGDALIHLASRGGNIHILRSIISSANINSRGRNGWTPLMRAAISPNPNVFNFLWSHNADFSPNDVYNDSLLHLACRGGSTEIVHHLVSPSNINSRGRHGWTPAMKAAANGRLEVFEFLVSQNADLSAVDEYGDSLLHLASSGGNTDIVYRTMSHSNVNSRGRHGWTPVMKAAQRGKRDVFDFLVSHNADLTALDEYGDSLLHLACSGGNIDIITSVLTPSNINSRGRHGWTPAMKAAKCGNQDVVDFLVSHNTVPTLVGEQGDSTQHEDSDESDTEIIYSRHEN